ncbi:acetylornithine aminotransferase [Hymenopellis radicata]|nr:acetylornithine aminotransferase [Hymenopellis radicata]
MASLQALGKAHVTKGLGRLTHGIMSKGSGSYLEFTDGRKVLDFSCGIGVTGLGHCHPKVSQAAADQCMNLVHGQCSIAFHAPYLRLIEKLLPVMPHPSLDSFFFWNSGSEAVECSMKMARIITGRPNIICMQGGYHGRTYGAMAVTTSKTIYFEGNGALMPGAFKTPFPYWHQMGLPPTTPAADLTQAALYQLRLLLAQQSAPKDTAALIIETVLGEGGYVPAPPEFLRGLRQICDEHGILLIIDEVQCGFGRTGTWWAIEESGVKPDILLSAKGLANGFPLSAVISRTELTDKLKPGMLGGTYAGNPVSCAAAVAVAEAMQEEKVLSNVEARSRELFSSLNSLAKDPAVSPYIVDVRGRGLMVGVEFASATFPVTSANAPPPIAKVASLVAQRCLEKGLLILTTSIYEVVRFIPTLNSTAEEIKEGCKIFADAVKEVIAENRN